MITFVDLKTQQIERVYAARHRKSPYRRNGVHVCKCSLCKRTRIGPGKWAYVPDTKKEFIAESVSHGYCPICFKIQIDGMNSRKEIKNNEFKN